MATTDGTGTNENDPHLSTPEGGTPNVAQADDGRPTNDTAINTPATGTATAGPAVTADQTDIARNAPITASQGPSPQGPAGAQATPPMQGGGGPPPGGTAQFGKAPPPEKPSTPEQLIADLSSENARLKASLAAVPTSLRQFLMQFPSSGLFFIVLGATLLYIAKRDMGSTHAAFSFILVVLGVAILLYGTGTQSSGNFNSNATAAGYNIAIAGGAGVLAVCVAYGMLWNPQGLKDTFQIERKYLRITLESLDGSSPLDQYRSEFTIDGMPIPSLKRAQYIEVFVPYFNSEIAPDGTKLDEDDGATNLGCDAGKDSDEVQFAKKAENVKVISAVFHTLDNDTPRPLEKSVPQKFRIWLSTNSIKNRNSSFDFPFYYKRKCINLQSIAQSQAVLQRTTANETPPPQPAGAEKAPEDPVVTVAPILVTK